jgi:hypothetical protein
MRGDLDYFGEQVQEFADTAVVSKEYLLGLISQVLNVAQQGSQRALDRMAQVKLLFGHGICLLTTAPELPVPPPQVARMHMLLGFDWDMPLGTVQVG